MNKHWGDKADKDLFFTILSVKNIGVITGAEWGTIGNTMRMMGYGFTNEGCRQHFQNLRRAQHKAATDANLLPDGRFKHDPSQNPITRRPGPGRGRPRKNAAVKPDTIPTEPLAEGVRIVSVGPRVLMPAPPPGGVVHHHSRSPQQPHSHTLPQHGPPPPANGVPVHHGLPTLAYPAQPPAHTSQSPPLQRSPPAPITENDDAPGEDEPPSKRPRVDGDEPNSTIVNLVLAPSTQLEEESADDMEDDDEEEELFGGSEALEDPPPGATNPVDVVSNQDAEAAVLTLVAAGDDPPAPGSNASSPSWGTPPQTDFVTNAS